MRPQTSPTTHKARGRSQKYTFHPIIVIVIMLTMTMIIINGDHLHLSIILILSPLFTPLSQILWHYHIIIMIMIMVMIMIMIMIVYDAYDVRWWSLTMNDCQHSPKTRQTVPWRDLKATTTILTSEAGDLPQTSRTSHQHCQSTPQRHYLNNVWGLA